MGGEVSDDFISCGWSAPDPKKTRSGWGRPPRVRVGESPSEASRRRRSRVHDATVRERADRRSPRRAERPPAGPPTLAKHTPCSRPRAREPKTRRFRGSADGRDCEGARAGASATRTRASRGERTNGTHHLDEVPCEPRERASQRDRGVRRRGRFSSENFFMSAHPLVGRRWLCTRLVVSTALDRRSPPRRRGPRRPGTYALSRAHRHARG